MNYDWPGNVRELANAMERAVVLGASELIYPEDLPDSVVEAAATEELPEGSFYHAVRGFKGKLIRKAMQDAGGSYVKAAGALDLHPNSLHRLVRNLKLNRENLQSDSE
jgi:Nif-specific regulatory protein